MEYSRGSEFACPLHRRSSRASVCVPPQHRSTCKRLITALMRWNSRRFAAFASVTRSVRCRWVFTDLTAKVPTRLKFTLSHRARARQVFCNGCKRVEEE